MSYTHDTTSAADVAIRSLNTEDLAKIALVLAKDRIAELERELAAAKAALGNPIGRFEGVRHTPAGTREFWGYLYGTTTPERKFDLYTLPADRGEVK